MPVVPSRPRSRLTACPSTPCRRRRGAAEDRRAANPTLRSASSPRPSTSSASSATTGRRCAASRHARAWTRRWCITTSARRPICSRRPWARRCDPTSTSRPCSTGPQDGLGERIVRYVLDAWEQPETRKRGVTLLRAGIGNRLTTPLLAGFLQRELIGRIAAKIDTPDAAFRASLVASQIAGHPDRSIRAAAARARRSECRRHRRAGGADRAAVHDRSNRRSGGRELTMTFQADSEMGAGIGCRSPADPILLPSSDPTTGDPRPLT